MEDVIASLDGFVNLVLIPDVSGENPQAIFSRNIFQEFRNLILKIEEMNFPDTLLKEPPCNGRAYDAEAAGNQDPDIFNLDIHEDPFS